MEDSSDIEDCYPEKVLDSTHSGLLKSIASYDREFPQNFITFRKALSWQSKCAMPSYVEIAFRTLRSDQQSNMRYFGKCNHAAVHNTKDDSLLDSSSTCSRTPSQNSYFDFKTIPYTSASVSESQQKFENAKINSFLHQEHRNARFSSNYFECNNKISRNIIALDLSSARSSLKLALRESVKMNSIGDFQTNIDHLDTFSSVQASRNRPFGRSKDAADLRRSSSQSASWHCGLNTKKREQNCNLFRLLLGSDFDWVHDPHIHNNISETGEILDSEMPSDTCMSESILQDCQSQQARNGYLQKLVDLASQLFLRWKSEDRHDEDASASQGNSSLTIEESSNLSVNTNQDTNSDTEETSELNTQTTSELQRLEPNPSGSLGYWKESLQVVVGKSNIFKILKQQLGGWRMSRVVAQEKHPQFYEIDLGSDTLFAGKQALAVAIKNGTTQQLGECEQISAKFKNKCYTCESEEDMNHEQNGDNFSSDSQDFKRGKLTKHYTSECKDKTVKRQGHSMKFGISETSCRHEKALKRCIERGNRSARIGLKDSTRKQKNWYRRNSKLKRKMLRVRDGIKYRIAAGVRGREEEDQSHVGGELVTRERAGTEDMKGEYNNGHDADDDKEEEDDEEERDDEENVEEDKEEEEETLLQQQFGQLLCTENLSSDSTSECVSENYSNLKLHKTNSEKWRENIAAWRQKREDLLLSRLHKDGYKSEQARITKLGKVRTNNKEKSIKSTDANSDSESTEMYPEEKNVQTFNQRNLTRKENILRDMKIGKAQERKVAKNKEGQSLWRGNVGENVGDCEQHSSECDQCTEYYTNHSTWKSLATEIRKRQSGLFRYRIKPQMSDNKDSAFLLNRIRELERNRVSEYLSRFHIARKSFFVNYDMEIKDKWTEKTRDKWLQDKYRSSPEEHKLLTSSQMAKGDAGKEEQNMLKEVYRKMEEIASGENRNDNDRDAMSLDKWLSLLETLIKANEKVDDNLEAKDNKRRKRSIGKKQTLQWQTGDCVHNGRVKITELGKRQDFNLNKEILDWMDDSQCVEVSKGGGYTFRKRESTEMEKIQRRIKYAENNKAVLGGQGRETLADLDEISKKKVMAEIKSNEKKTESSKNLYKMSVSKKVGHKHHTIMKVEHGITKSIQNGQQNTNNDTVEEEEKYIDLKSANNKEVTKARENMGNYEQKENEIESSDRNEVLNTLVKEEPQINELKDYDIQDDKIKQHTVKENKFNRSADYKENQRVNLLPAKDTSGDKEGTLDKPSVESYGKKDLEGNIRYRDDEIEINDSEKINLVYSVLEKNGGFEERENIIGASGDETLKETTSGENVKVLGPSRDIHEPEGRQLHHWSPEAKYIKIEKRGSEGQYARTLVPISERDSEVESNVSEDDQRSGQLIDSTVVISKDTSPSERKGGTIKSSLPFEGVVSSPHANFLKQRIIEEIAKFSARNIRPIVEVPERRTLMEPPEAKPMYISRKTLDAIDGFLGIKVSSWLVPEGTITSEECSSSASSLNLQAEKIVSTDKLKSTHTADDAHLNAPCPMPIRNPDLDNLVENSRELTFYQPSLPISAHYKCFCVDCRKNCRSGKPASRRMRSRITLLSTDNFRCKVTRNRSHPETRFNQDAWANSDLERSSRIKQNKRIYRDRLFKRKISVKNILKLCSKFPGWNHPMISAGMLNISAEDCNEHDKLCLAMCLNAGDFKNKSKADFDYSPSDPTSERRSKCMKKDLKVPSEHKYSKTSNDCSALDTCLENTYKFDSVHNHKYTSFKPDDCLENARGYTSSSQYKLPLSQLPASNNPHHCNLSTAGDNFDHHQMLNFYNSTKYITTGVAMTWPVYRLPSVGSPLTSYEPDNCYSRRRPASASYQCRSCPSGLTPDTCYSSRLLTRYSYTHPTTSWCSPVSASSLYTYRASNHRRPASLKYCSGCQVPSSSPFKNCPGNLNFSIHNYV